ncbi:radical SAM protein [Candidatus Altiarchaeota archaeon]
MNVLEKVQILSAGSKYDTCSAGVSKRKISGLDRVGNAAVAGICATSTEGGKKVNLFKTLYSNTCTHDCAYCTNSTTCKKRTTKAIYEPQELAKVFMKLYVRNYVEGLFLSSGVPGNPDFISEQMLETVKILRHEHRFQGYIHFKALPGVSFDLLKEASGYVDRMSVNLEAPSKGRLSEISSTKEFGSDIVKRQSWIKKLNLPSGQSTQLVVGAAGESDLEILETMKWEYKEMKVKRFYYSHFKPVEGTELGTKNPVSRTREAHLYNTDWLLRKYRLPFNEIKEILDDDGFLPQEDPKLAHAKKFLDDPVDVDEASYEELIRVPGIGLIGARRIISYRKCRIKKLKRREIHKAGVVLKRAEPFLKINGHVQKTLGEFR